MEDRELVKMAEEAKSFSYSPYSNFRVGAAILIGEGKVYTGVNIENASFGATCCAERTAVFKAVSEGEKNLKAVAISSDLEDFIYPCGICRQVLAEFGGSETRIICSNKAGDLRVHTLGELLPKAFIEFDVKK